ncbi:TIR domain-containing protein [Candidatus Dojkabacteria bacterium]|nr:TIR domain-containing protein [Candidatus Dojkabacteria bacterium]
MSEINEHFDVFLSYARADDENFVRKLYLDLTKAGIKVWWDRISMPGRGLTFLQEIRDAISNSDRLVLTLGPKAVISDYVTAEWKFALKNCIILNPILRKGNYHIVPEELINYDIPDFRDDSQYSDMLIYFVRQLRIKYFPLGNLHNNFPSLPPHYLPRNDEIDQLKLKLLTDSKEAIVVTSVNQTTSLLGMGGVGKSVLASAFARDCEVRRYFHDGISWLVFGQTASDLQIVSNLNLALNNFDHEQEYITDISNATERLSECLANKACLMILDDIWKIEHAEPFINAIDGSRCRVLITTRDRTIVSGLGSQPNYLDVLSKDESLTLLMKWSGLAKENFPEEAYDIVDECGNLPLAIAMIGAAIQKNPNSWERVLFRLRYADLDKIEQRFKNYPYPNLLKAIQVSLETLDTFLYGRYIELGIFPEKHPIPQTALLTFWQSHNLNKYDVQEIVDAFVDRSLGFLNEQGSLLIHDLQYDFISRQIDNIEELHKQLVKAYWEKCSDGWVSGPDDGYYFENLTYHLLRAGKIKTVAVLLVNYRWLEKQLQTGNLVSLLHDYQKIPDNYVLTKIGSALRLSAHILGKDCGQLRSQLIGRLFGSKENEIQNLLKEASSNNGYPWFEPIYRNLIAPDQGLFRVFETDARFVRDLKISKKGDRLFSLVDDNTIRIWDVQSGKLENVIKLDKRIQNIELYEETNSIFAVSNNQIGMWDINSGEFQKSISFDGIYGLAISPDGQCIISGNSSGNLIHWDFVNKSAEIIKAGHFGSTITLFFTPDNRKIVSVSCDGNVKIFDKVSFQEISSFSYVGNNEREISAYFEFGLWHVIGVTFSPDGKSIIISRDDKDFLSVWDLETGLPKEPYIGEGIYGFDSIVISQGLNKLYAVPYFGKIISVWQYDDRSLLGYFKGPDAPILVTPNNKYLISSSPSENISMWDIKTINEFCAKNYDSSFFCNDSIIDIVTSDDSEFMLAATKTHLYLWNLQNFPRIEKTFNIETNLDYKVNKLSLIPEQNRVIISNTSSSLWLWDFNSNEFSQNFYDGRMMAITPDSIGVCPKYMAISNLLGGYTTDIIVFNLEDESEICRLRGHRSKINSLLFSPDGKKLISASEDGLINIWDVEVAIELYKKYWDLKTGALDLSYRRHESGVNHVEFIFDKNTILSSSKDGIIRIWNINTGEDCLVMPCHTKEIIQTIIMPGENVVVTVSSDKTIKAWNIRSKECMAVYTGDFAFSSCASSVDKWTLIAGDISGKIHFLRFNNLTMKNKRSGID